MDLSPGAQAPVTDAGTDLAVIYDSLFDGESLDGELHDLIAWHLVCA